MARKRGSGRATWRLRLLGAVLLLALLGGAFGWWHLHHWRPDRAIYRVQGIEASATDGEIDWRAVKAALGIR